MDDAELKFFILLVSSEQYDEMKSIVEAAFARMPGSVCKRDALLKWCGEKLANYVRESIRDKPMITEFHL